MDDEWLRMFKDNYIEKGKHDLQSQVPYLSDLAAEYEDRYQTSNNWTDCLKAHAIYSSCGAREPSHKKWSKHAYSLQQAYWKGRETIDFQSQQQLTESLSKEINKIRSDFRLKVESIYKECDTLFPPSLAHLEDQSPLSTGRFNDMMKDVSTRCTEQMIGFACRIMEGAVDALKERPPCPFTVAAIGSLARGEATPYSDLEYMFIVEEKTENTVKYFETLAVTSYFLIGSLRETKLSYMAISELDGWFEDFSTNGFKIDGLSPGAGNIPTGYGSDEGNRNHFIVTSEELIERYRAKLHNPIEKEALRGDLTAMLAYIKPIFTFGDNMCVPAIKRAVSDMTPNTKRKEINMRMLQTDIHKFDFTPDEQVRAKVFRLHIKKDVFRFPSILLLDLTQVFQLAGNSTWETLDFLLQNQSISEPFHAALSFLVTSACFIRLAAYLYHDSQDDRMSVAPESEQVQLDWSSLADCVSKLVQNWHPPKGLFFSMMNSLIPLKRLLDTSNEHITKIMKSSEQMKLHWADKIRALYSCERVTDALNVLQDEFGTGVHEDTECVVKQVAEQFPTYIEEIAGVFFRSSCYREALVFYSYIARCATASDETKTNAEWRILHIQNELGNHDEVQKILRTTKIGPEYLNQSKGMLHIHNAKFSKDKTELLNAEMHFLKALAFNSRAYIHDNSSHALGTVRPARIDKSLQQTDIDIPDRKVEQDKHYHTKFDS